jgi:hypothetical protein
MPRAKRLGGKHPPNLPNIHMKNQPFVSSAGSVQYSRERRATPHEGTDIARVSAIACNRVCTCTKEEQLRLEALPIPQYSATARGKEHPCRPVLHQQAGCSHSKPTEPTSDRVRTRRDNGLPSWRDSHRRAHAEPRCTANAVAP